MCAYQGTRSHMCPRAALQLFLDTACTDSFTGPACFRKFHPVGGRRRGKEGSGKGATPTFLCCPLISAAVYLAQSE